MRILLVGGTKSFVDNSIKPKLEDHGLSVDWHHNGGTSAIPGECDAVIVLKEMVGGAVTKHYKSKAKEQGIAHAEVPQSFSKAKKNLLLAGIIDQSSLDTVQSGKRVSRRSSSPTPQQKIEAATQYILSRLQNGEHRTTRDMLRARMKDVFNDPRVSISDNDIRKARAQAAEQFEARQNTTENTTENTTGEEEGSEAQEALWMFLSDYPESTKEGVYKFLSSLYDVEGVHDLLDRWGMWERELARQVAQVRDELYKKWSKPFHLKTDEEHKDMVDKRFDYLVRTCLKDLRAGNPITPWSALSKGARKVYGSTPPSDHIRLARQMAQEKFDKTFSGEPDVTVTTETTVVPPDSTSDVWFRNYKLESIQTFIDLGIRLYKKLSQSQAVVISSWMEENQGVGRNNSVPGVVAKVFKDVKSQITVITVLFLCWHNLGGEYLPNSLYRHLYHALRGSGLGSYAVPMVYYYVNPDGTWRNPVVPVDNDSESAVDTTPVEDIMTPVEDIVTPVDDHQALSDTSTMEAKLDAILAAQQAANAHMIAAQQAQTASILSALTDTTDAIKTALGGLAEVLKDQNDALVQVTERVLSIDDGVKRTGMFVEGVVSTVEANNGFLTASSRDLQDLGTKLSDVAEARKLGFNDESKEVLVTLLAQLQELNNAKISDSLDGLEDRIISTVVKAVVESRGSDLTIREVINSGARFSIKSSKEG